VIPHLPNVQRDGDLLQNCLEKLGWEVWRLRDPTWKEADRRLEDFIGEQRLVAVAVAVAVALGHQHT
jgi:hypothetical protein